MASFFLYVTAAIFILYILIDVTWRLQKRRYLFLPFAPNIPWLGCLPFVGSSSHDFFNFVTKYYMKYDHLYVMWLGPRPAVRIGCIEYLEPLLRSQKILKKSSLYDQICEWVGIGLLTATGKKWKKRRLALTPAFHFSILKNFIHTFEFHGNNLVEKLRDLIKEEEKIEVQSLTSLATLDVMCETSMGVKMNALKSLGSAEYVKSVDQVKTHLLWRTLNPLVWRKSVYQYTSAGKLFYQKLGVLHNFTTNVINEHIALRKEASTDKVAENKHISESKEKKKKVFLDILLDLYDNNEIDLQGIREEVDTFMFEGHDTTSSALSWTIYEIGRHPEVQEKLMVEADQISSLEGSLLDKIRSMKYLENVIKESLRLHPPVPLFGRILEEDLMIDENIIPAGTEMIVESFSVHMNEKYWENPKIFNPDRFASEEFLRRNPYCYIPFSAGPRNCIGQKFAMLEIKIVMFTLIHNFRWKSLQTPDELETSIDIITHAAKGIFIKFSNR